MASIGESTAEAAAMKEQIQDKAEDTTLRQDAEQSTSAGHAVEMSQLPAQPPATTTSTATEQEPAAQATAAVEPPTVAETSSTAEAARPTALNRSETAEFALGPDGAALPTQQVDSAEPILRITLMLTTGEHRPDFTNTEPAVSIGPFPTWGGKDKIVAMDPFGHLAPWLFKRTI